MFAQRIGAKMNHIPCKGTTPALTDRAVEGAVPLLGGLADYAALIQRESAKWAGIVRASGATAE